MKDIRVWILSCLLLVGCQSGGRSSSDNIDTTFRVSRLISTGMIAQRGAVLPVWGYAPPGTEVTVTMGEDSHRGESARDGKWRVELMAQPVGGPHSMEISDGTDIIEVSDIWFGDVWVASGQSNMAWLVSNSNNAEEEIASADHPLIRHFRVPLSWSENPEDELAGGDWQIADPEHVGSFSAVAYYFARELQKHVDVPIGLVHSSWGGSRVEPWMSLEVFGEEKMQALKEEDQEREEALRDRLYKIHGALPAVDEGLVDGNARWADPELDTSDWAEITAPGRWEEQGYDEIDGIGWYRLKIELTAEEIGDSDVMIGLGRIDDSDISWVNGVQIGSTTLSSRLLREYVVPAGTLHPGTNVITVRAEDTGGVGGIRGEENEMWLETAQGRRPLAGSWEFKIGALVLPQIRARQHEPTQLYNKMIHPMLSYPVMGFLWYQGESNAGEADAVEYAGLFQKMITSWRELWGVEDAPFLFVQLANFMQPSETPTESNWAVLRESQTAALDLPNVGQAVIIDIGEANDIHPRNKQDVGLRLSLAARHIAYGEDIEYSGPMYASHRVDGGSIVIEFSHAESGLVTHGASLGGFAVAGSDGTYHWATATIEGASITVSSSEVSIPVSVRYAWADNPDRANLYNGEGLPTSPFRTDGQ